MFTIRIRRSDTGALVDQATAPNAAHARGRGRVGADNAVRKAPAQIQVEGEHVANPAHVPMAVLLVDIIDPDGVTQTYEAARLDHDGGVHESDWSPA